MHFDQVKWLFTPYQDDRGYFIGLAFRAQYGDPCSAIFTHNVFQLNGALTPNPQTKGLFIFETENTADVSENRLDLKFDGCTFDEHFGQLPLSYIARVDEYGQYLFVRNLLGTKINRQQLMIRAGAAIRDTMLSLQISIV